MTDREYPDDETQAMPASDETQVMPSSDDATRVFSPRSTASAPAPAPATERIALPARSTNISTWLIATVAVIALIAGAVLGYVQHRPSGHNVIARRLVGPDGGVMTFDSGGRLVIPKGALPTLTSITIRKETVGRRVRLGPEGDPRTVVYEPGTLTVYVFEPADLRFQKYVTIDLPRTGDASAVLVDSKTNPHIVAAQPNSNVVELQTDNFAFENVR